MDFISFIFWFLSSIVLIAVIVFVLSILKTKADITDLNKKIEVLQNDELKH